jgi:hypothetical protein
VAYCGYRTKSKRGLRKMIVMEELLTPKDIATALRISEYKAKEMIRTGVIEGVKVDGRWRVRPAKYQEYLDSLSQKQQDK